MNRYELALDLDKSAELSCKGFKPVVLRQGENEACEIAASITDHGKRMPTEGLTPVLAAKMPSGTYHRQDGTWVDGKAFVEVDEAYFASEIGEAWAYFELRDYAEHVMATTFKFPMWTLANVTGDGEPAEPYDSEIEAAITEMHDFINAATVLSIGDVDALFSPE